MPDLDKLHEHVKKLDLLLSDRQEGISSWAIMVSEHWKAISEMWDGPKEPLSDYEYWTGVRWRPISPYFLTMRKKP